MTVPSLLPRFIVAECTKGWCNGRDVAGPEILAVKFERIISVNLERGYVLRSWVMTSVSPEPGSLVETIVAVRAGG